MTRNFKLREMYAVIYRPGSYSIHFKLSLVQENNRALGVVEHRKEGNIKSQNIDNMVDHFTGYYRLLFIACYFHYHIQL